MSKHILFNTCASPNSHRALSHNLEHLQKSSIPKDVSHRTFEFEWEMESIMRHNNLDPNLDSAWKEAGFPGGRQEAVDLIRAGYNQAVSSYLDIFKQKVKYDGYDFLKHILQEYNSDKDHSTDPNAFESAVRSITRANIETDRDIQTDDTVWREAGVEGGLEGLRSLVQEIFIEGNVGSYLAYHISDQKHFNTEQLHRLSLVCADGFIRKTMPRAADKLGIPQNDEALNSFFKPRASISPVINL